MQWQCPRCRGRLATLAGDLACGDCRARYPLVAGIPDLRIPAAAWIDFDADRARALAVERMVGAAGLEAAISDIFRTSRGLTGEKAAYRMRQVLAGVGKSEEMVDGWLRGVIERPVLDIGCGPGQFLAALARRGLDAAGIDVSLEWLVVAKHLIAREGGTPDLAAALAEHLPVASGSVMSVVSLDVIEHVGDQQAYACEIMRILAPGGRFALVTPNRYSLSPEPHVGVWGVGWLPVRLQARWVRLCSGQSYEFTRLLSAREARALVERPGEAEVEIRFPAIADEEIALFTPGKRRLARLYNFIANNPIFRPAVHVFGAYFQLIGRKRRTS